MFSLPFSTVLLRVALLFCLLGALGTEVQLRAQPVISGFDPQRNTTATAVSSNIVLTWSQAMSTATLTSGTIRVYGSQRGWYSTNANYSYSGGNTVVTVDPAMNFKPGELISVSVTNAQSAANVPMTRATVWSFTAAVQGGAGVFATGASYSVGITPGAVTLGDFNSDGNLDIAVINETSDSFSVLLGTGSGSFGAATDYATGSSPLHINSGDFNSDGIIDLVYTDQAGTAATVRLGTGTGTFGAAVDYFAGTFTRHVEVADLNGDGNPDLAVTSSDAVYVLLGQGDGTFAAAIGYTAGLVPRVVRSGDVDRDGDLDLVVGSIISDDVSVLLGNGDGTFNASVQYGSVDNPHGLQLADFNGDGHLDIATANFDGATNDVSVFLGTGTGSFGAQTNFLLPARPYSLAVGDFDSDRDIDIAVALFSTSTTAILHNDGTGSFGAPVLCTTNSATWNLAAGDVDNDGDLDLVVSEINNAQVGVLLNMENLHLVAHTPDKNAHNIAVSSNITMTFSSALNAATVTGANIRIRGEYESLMSTRGTFSVNGTTATFDYSSMFRPGELVTVTVTRAVQSAAAVNLTTATVWQFRTEVTTGNAYFTVPTTHATGDIPRYVESGDFDRDGDLDLAVVNQGTDNVSVYLGNGDGTFAAAVNYAVGDWAYGIDVGDFNNDGIADIATANAVTNNATILLGNGDGTFAFSANYPSLGGGALQVHNNDFNGDGNVDIAIVNLDGVLTTYMGRGNGTFGSSATYNIINSTSVESGDFDGDGDIDLVATRNSGNHIWMITNDGAGTFTVSSSATVATFPYAVSAGELNGDGYLDLVAANSGSSNVSVLIGNGDGTFAAAVNYAADAPSYSVKIGDFDGDGDLDIVAASGWANDVSVFLNTGTGTFSTAANYKAGTSGSVLFGVETGDFDGDGDLDIAATSSTNDELSILLNEPHLRLLSHTPRVGDFTVENDADIAAVFSHPLDAASVTSANIRVWGSQSGLLSTRGTFSVDGTTATFDYNSVFKPGELVTVDVTSAVVSTIGAPLTTATVWQFRAEVQSGTGVFGTADNYSTQNRPGAITLADFNGDTAVDMAVINENSSSLSVLMGDGAGAYGAAVHYAAGSSPLHINNGDFNSDGVVDLVYTNMSVHTLSVRLGTGAGVFDTAVSYATGVQPKYVEVADLNGDGHQDLAVTNNINVQVMLGRGNGTFAAAVNYTAGTSPLFVRSGDLDGDGDLDLAVTNVSSDNVSILLNRGNGTFAAAVNYGSVDSPQEVELADFDGDGDLDMATVNLNTFNLSVFPGTGTGSFGAQVNYSLSGQPYSLAVGDYDADGDPDIAAALYNTPNVAVLRNNGTGTFGAATNYPAKSAVSKVQTGDVDNDGDLDLVVSEMNNSRVGVLLNLEYPQLVSHTPGSNAQNVDAAADIEIVFSEALNAATVTGATIVVRGDQTGLLSTTGTFSVNGTTATFDYSSLFKPGELVSVSVTTGVRSTGGLALADPEVWQFRTAVQGGYAVLRPNGSAMGTNYSYDVALADLDGDGDLDGVVANRSYGSTVWLNNGFGEFTYAGYISFNWTYALALGDIDGDSDIDIVLANDFNEANEIFLNDGAANFTESAATLGNNNSLNTALGDLDGDGDLDAVVTNWGQGNTVWMNNGAGVFTQSTGGTLGSEYSYGVALGDLDNDGDLDAAIATIGGGNRLWFNNGTGTFASTTATLGTATSVDIALGDIDNDGDLDAVIANADTDNTVWLNNGTGQFTASTATLGAESSNAVTLGDLDGDGDLDAVVANRSGDTSMVWINNGGGQFTRKMDSDLGVSEAAETALGDLDGDGDLDAVVVSDSDHANTVWINGPRLAITTVAPATPASGDDIALAVSAQFADGTPYTVTTATTVGLTWDTSVFPMIGGATQATIAAGTTTTTITVSVLSQGAATTFTVSVVSGESLSRGRRSIAVDPRCTSVVTNTNNDGYGSLRRAVAATCTGGTVTFATSGTIALTTGQISVMRTMTIDATGASVTVSGNSSSRVFYVATTASVTIAGLSMINGYAGDGGAVYPDGTLSLSYVVISECTAANGGGAVGTFNNNPISLSHVTIANCVAGNNGGAVFSFGTIEVSDSDLNNNTAGNNGGALSSFNAIAISNSTLTGNTAGNGGGAVQAISGLTVTDVVFSGNHTGNGGGAINNGGTATITSATLTNNTAGNNGGAISNSGTMLLSNSTVSDNTANNTGGGVSNFEIMIIENTSITGNTAMNGGGVCTFDSLQLADVLIDGNRSSDDGGGVYSTGPITASNTTITNNRTTGDGGGIHTLTSLLLSNSTVSNNSSDGSGGAIRTSGTANISNTSLTGNYAKVSGGAVNHLTTILMTDVQIDSNRTDGDGGALYSTGALTLSNTTITDNSANGSGGGIYTLTTITASTATISRNYAGSIGGALRTSGQAFFNNSTIGENSAASAGGIFSMTTLEVQNSVIHGNTARTAEGGGVLKQGGLFSVVNTTISGNTAATTGGGIAVNLGTFRATNATVSANSAATGGGIFIAASSSAELLNTIAADNNATAGPDIAGATGGTVTSSGYNLIGTTAVIPVSWQASDITGAGAGLAPLANYGGSTLTMRPMPGSPAIDAGTQATTTDQRGFSRPVGTADIGAVETNYQFALTGTPQTVLASAVLPQPLGLTLTESGQPVVGVQLTLSAPATGASIVFPNGTTTTTVTTDVAGTASTTATAGAVSGTADIRIPGTTDVYQVFIQTRPVVATSAVAVSTNEDTQLLVTVQIADDGPLSSLVVTATSSNLTLIPANAVQQQGSTGATTSFLIVPAANLSGTGSITVTATDTDGYTGSTTFVVTVVPVNDGPAASTTQTVVEVNEDTSGMLTVAIADIDDPYSRLVVTATSGNQVLIPDAALVMTGTTSATTSFAFTPAADAYGSTPVTITVSDGTDITTATFTVNVLPVNDAPTVSTTLTLLAIDENASTTLTVSVADIDNTYGELTVSAASDNQVLLSDLTIVQNGGTGATTSFTLTPTANSSGTAHITVSVSDGQYSAVTTLTLTVNVVNYPPAVSTTLAVVTMNEDTPATLVVAISDANNTFGELTVTATSSNQSLIADAAIMMQGSTAATTVFIATPAPDASGSAQITIQVNDGIYSASTTITVVVLPVNDAPVMSTTQTIATLNEGATTTLTVAIADIDNAYAQLVVTAVSDNQVLLPDTSLVQSGATGATTSFVITPSANMNGTAQITLAVSDGEYSATTTITVTVLPVNNAPTVSTTQTAIVLNEDATTTLTVAIGDIDNTYGQLTVTAVSDNQALLPDASLVQSGATGATTSFTAMPAANMNGTANVTLTVSDGVYSASTTIIVTVLPVNDAPVVATGQTTVVISEDVVTTLTVAIADIDNMYDQLAVTATSDNEALLPNSALVQSGATGATTSFTATPAANMNGTANVTLTVSDGVYSASTVITVSVLPANDAPTVSTTQTAVIVGEDETTTLTVAVADIDNTYGQLTVTAASDNQALLPDASLVQSGVTGATTAFAVTPSANMHGTVHVTLTASDGVYTASTTVTITVLPVNDAPGVVVNTGLTVDEGATAVVTASILAVADIEQPATELVYTITSATTHGWLLKNGVATSGTFTQADINSGVIGYRHNGSETLSDSFAFSVDDGAGGTTEGIFVIAVQPLNDAPTAANDEDSTCVGGSVVVHPLVNDSDSELNTLTITGVTQPQYGSVSIAPGDTTVVYTPSDQFQGADAFSYTIADGMGGTSTATVSVQIRSTIEADAGDDVFLCNGSETQLAGVGTSAVGSIEFTWTPAAGLSNPSIANPVARPDTTTTYVLTVVDGNGCRATDTLVVVVLPSVAYSVSTDASICAGGSTQLEATGGVEYLWSPATGLNTTTTAVVIASPTETTTYTVEITAPSGCRITTTVTITVYDAAIASAGADVTVCGGSSVQLSASGGVSYQWSPSTGLSNAFIADPVASPTTTTTYTVTVWSASGCESSDEVTVSVVPAHLDIRVLLEGAYAGASGMSTSLRQQDLVPVEQPYTVSPFNYGGSETLTTTADSVVDWVLVEVRSGVEPGTVVGRKAALLLSDGRIVESSGESLEWAGLSGGESYHVVVYHRNHLGVMSAESVSATGCVLSYDFRLSSTAAYEQFMSAQKELETGAWGMVSGDADANGIVNASDRVLVRNESGVLGYRATDLSLDGIVNAVDRVISRNNTFRTSQVP